jgi:hypothetical protein
MGTPERFDWRIKDVVEATGLGYDYIRRALLSGELDGLVAPRLLRTNEAAVAAWLETLRVKPQSKPSPPSPSPGRKPRGRGAYQYLDPGTFGKRG